MWMLPRLATPPALHQPLHVSEFPFTNHRITLAVYSDHNVAEKGMRHNAGFRSAISARFHFHHHIAAL